MAGGVSVARRLPFPDFLLATPCEIHLNGEGLDEDGAPLPAATWAGKAIYSEKAKTVVDAQRRLVRIEGVVVIKGDAAPDLAVISDGVVTAAGKQYSVYRASRPRNPDGTIHHTTLELI